MSHLRLATAGAAVTFACAILPSAAGAADYCVSPNQSCGQNNVASLQDGLDQAASTDEGDRLLLGADIYVAPAGGTGFNYADSSPLEIVGAGRGQTILTAQQNAVHRVLYLDAWSGSSIHDLTVRIPQEVAENFSGLVTTSAARRIEVTAEPIQGKRHYGAVLEAGAVLEDSSVTLDPGENSIGVMLHESNAFSGPNVLRRSAIRAEIGAQIQGPNVMERSRVIAGARGVTAAGSDIAITDSLLVLLGNAGTVLRAETATNWNTNVTADGLTIYAPNQPDTGGVAVSTAPDSARSAHLTLTNSIVRGFTPLAAVAGGAGTGTISASYSDYDPNGNIAFGASASIAGSNVSNVGDAGLNEQPGHEYSLLPDSPLLDMGDPGAPQGLDLTGNPRVADGNGDGIARRDLGAFELQPPSASVGESGSPAAGGPGDGAAAADTDAPRVSGFRSTRSVFAVARAATPRAARAARGTRLRYALTENARVVLKIQRRLAGSRFRTVGTLRRQGLAGPNRVRFTGRIGRRALRPGRYRAVITATDAAGNRSAPVAARFRIVR